MLPCALQEVELGFENVEQQVQVGGDEEALTVGKLWMVGGSELGTVQW